MVLLSLAAGVTAGAAELTPRQEAALFSLSDLGPVDISRKTVTVEVYVAPGAELAPFLRMQALVWERVENFYARMGVKLAVLPGRAAPGPLAPARRLRVELLPHKEWLDRSCRAFNVAPPFRLRFLQVCRDKYAFAHLPLSVVHISFKRFQEAEFSDRPAEVPLHPVWLGNLLTHELGHLVGLYHSHEFVNDPVPEFLPDGHTPNFMSHHIAVKGDLGFVDFQKRLVHSYLSRGKVFQQYEYVDFDPLRYLELMKKYNGYREPAPEKKAAAEVESIALGGDDDGDDDDDLDDYARGGRRE